MPQGFHHRLLLSGLLLLAGLVVAVSRWSNSDEAAAVSRSMRSSSVTARSSRAGAEALPVLPSVSADEGRGQVAAEPSRGPAAVASAASRQEMVTVPLASGPVIPEAGNAGEELPVHRSGSEESGFVSASAYTPELSFSNVHPWITQDPSAPGSSLSLDNQTASVTAAQPVAGSRGVALALVVEDAPPNPAEVPGFFPVAEAEPADVTDLSPPGPIARRSGFTHEQELFRTKWGWAAYDQVQKILREETSD